MLAIMNILVGKNYPFVRLGGEDGIWIESEDASCDGSVWMYSAWSGDYVVNTDNIDCYHGMVCLFVLFIFIVLA